MSPRRSSRARTQPSPMELAQTNSSSSSVASDRAQRSTRSANRPASPQRSNPRSQSQDDDADTPKLPPRRTRSGHADIKEPSPAADDALEDDEDDGQDENEVTRCICRSADYPGMSSPLLDQLKRAGYVPPPDIGFEAVGDFFVQCDTCKVWQHGGCVGIVDQAGSPDDYFCEECRKDLHKVATSPEGQRFSRYKPIMEEPPYRQSSKVPTRNGKGKDQKPRSSAESLAQKRRHTMNSRDEAEELARAIEESKRDKGVANATNGAAGSMRASKRAREDSDEYVSVPSTMAAERSLLSLEHLDLSTKQKLMEWSANRVKNATIKRQRTGSSSAPSDPKVEEGDEDQLSDADGNAAKADDGDALDATPKSKVRGAAARNHQAKEAREQKEREQRERERQQAATARKARSDRRGRAEDSDYDEQQQQSQPKEDQLPSTAASSPPAEPTPAPKSGQSAPASGTGKRKTSLIHPVPPARRGRGNKGQQGPEHDSPPGEAEETNLLNANPHNTRARSRSRSVVRGDDHSTDRRGGHTPNGAADVTGPGRGGLSAASREIHTSRTNIFDDGGLLSKPSKMKNFNEKRTSMNEMKKRVAAILEFVNRAQTERTTNGSTSGDGSARISRAASESGREAGTVNGVSGSVGPEAEKTKPPMVAVKAVPDSSPRSKLTFESMSSGQMLVNLKNRLQTFEGTFGRFGEK